MQKNYIIDTNVMIDDPNSLEILINGNENNIFIPKVVIEELDIHKAKTLRLKPQIREIINNLFKFKDHIKIFGKDYNANENPDDTIIKSIIENDILHSDGIVVSNDSLFRFKAENQGLKTQVYKSSIPFKSESEKYTGFIDPYTEDRVENCFLYIDGKLHQHKNGEDIPMNFDTSLWKIKPISKWQNACMMLLQDETIPLVSIQSFSGAGKSFLALAAALQLVLEKKLYKKIYIIKPNIEIGTEMGFLPGSVNDKMDPFFRPIFKLLTKLHNIRTANKIFNLDSKPPTLNEDIIEFMPINFLRGWDMEDCVVIFDEVQNISRLELRTFLTRLGYNVKCICTGDVNQIDNKHCNHENNGMNWMIKKFKNEKNYAHIVLNGNYSRGPIAEMTIKKGL